MEAPQAIEPPRGTGEGVGTAVEIPTSTPIHGATTRYFPITMASVVTWWYATTYLSVGAATSEATPWSISPMASRSFVFSDFYGVGCEILWHD